VPKRLPRARTLKGEPKLAHYDSGGGIPGEPPILLLHQSLARSEDWENIFPRLATRYRAIAYDARGHGRSGRAPDYSLRAFADDTLRVLREIAKEPAVLIGHSLGALAALVAAGDAPELVRGLVLEDPPLGYAKAWDPAQYGALREGIASNEPAVLAKAVSKQPLPSPGPRGERTYGELRGFYAAERVVTYFRDVDPAFIAPVLVLAGEPRLGGAVDDPAEWRLKKLANVTVKRFPGSGHLLHGFRPEQFIENIEPFLRKLCEGG